MILSNGSHDNYGIHDNIMLTILRYQKILPNSSIDHIWVTAYIVTLHGDELSLFMVM